MDSFKTFMIQTYVNKIHKYQLLNVSDLFNKDTALAYYHNYLHNCTYDFETYIVYLKRNEEQRLDHLTTSQLKEEARFKTITHAKLKKTKAYRNVYKGLLNHSSVLYKIDHLEEYADELKQDMVKDTKLLDEHYTKLREEKYQYALKNTEETMYKGYLLAFEQYKQEKSKELVHHNTDLSNMINEEDIIYSFKEIILEQLLESNNFTILEGEDYELKNDPYYIQCIYKYCKDYFEEHQEDIFSTYMSLQDSLNQEICKEFMKDEEFKNTLENYLLEAISQIIVPVLSELEIDNHDMIEAFIQNPNYNYINWQGILDHKQELEKNQQYVLERIPDHLPDLYPEARRMHRRFIIHAGVTNSGKTYQAIKRYKELENGIYLGPLRLLAQEIYENCMHDEVLCNLVTGEEQIYHTGSTHQSSTVEMCNFHHIYNIAVIDEAQMLIDEERGGFWTNAILGLQAKEIHICCALYAVDILKTLIEDCHDSYEIIEHQRTTPLVMQSSSFIFPRDVREHDAFIVFSRKKVHACAAELKKQGIPASIIYGALPYEVKQSEVQKFLDGTTKVVVSTDAIGMGMNLPIERIIFLESKKYDGNYVRILRDSEIQQIAGRAGRLGIYDIGYVNAEFDRDIFEKALDKSIPSIKKARLNFPETLLSLPFTLVDSLQLWNRLENKDYYIKSNTSRMIHLCSMIESKVKDKNLVYNLITIPFDESNDELMILWNLFVDMEKDHFYTFEYYSHYLEEENLLSRIKLDQLELLYEKADMISYYFQKFKHFEDYDFIVQYKRKVISCITAILEKQKFNTRRCKLCGEPLPWNYPYNYCDCCYHTKHIRFYDDYQWDV